MNEAKPKKQKETRITGHGNLTVSNVGSENSECITLTYTTFHVKTIENAEKLTADFKRKTGAELAADVTLTNFGTKEQDVKTSHKFKTCGSTEEAREIKEKCDKHIQKLGGQTTLTEDFEKEEKEMIKN